MDGRNLLAECPVETGTKRQFAVIAEPDRCVMFHPALTAAVQRLPGTMAD
ncbi:MAG: hypothetical protein MUE74_02565 [Bacteroidales bacterium]|nr:hypothetical protein [Bacteroidales bacterium]